MARYVAFLRGVNVGGVNVKMADLRAAATAEGYTNVRTILASGNVLFDAGEADRDKLKRRFEKCLSDNFGYEAWIILMDLPTVQAIVSAYPFDPERAGWHPYVVLSSDPAALEELGTVRDQLDPELERIQPGDGVLYWEVERGFTLKSAFGKVSAKAKYKRTTTTRNLRTMIKVLA